jgi:lysophospholipase L1-like esterase
MRKLRLELAIGCALLLLHSGIALAQVDFTRYIALGDSLTAGVVSYGSVVTYQQTSFPALLANQAGVASFQQPLVKEPGLPPLLYLKELDITSQGVSPVILMKSGMGEPTNYLYQGIYNNLGIDGAYTGDLLTRTGDINQLAADMGKYAAGQVGKVVPFSDLVLRDGQHTAIQFAIAAQPTFVTVWIGNNDVLGAALVATVIDGVTMTPLSVFTSQYQTLLGTLRSQLPNAKIVVATLPDCSALPFVTTVKPYLINPSTGQHIPLIGGNGLVTESDFLTLQASSLLSQGIGVPTQAGGTGLPLPEGSVDQTGLHAGVILRAAEVAAINARIAELNQVIKQTAASAGAKVVDMNAVFNDILAHGRIVGGIPLTSAFLTGGLFSYDGVHPQQIGYGVIANEFIKVLNTELGAGLPEVSLRPLLLGTQAATSVAAASFMFSPEAGIAMIKGAFPQADVSSLVNHVPVRRHLTGPHERQPLDPKS